MTSKDKPPVVVTSNRLEQYKINKTLKGKLSQFQKMREYMQLGGRIAPNAIRLFRSDYADIDRAVRSQSEGKQNAATVTWGGMPLVAHDDAPKPFALEASL